MSGHSKWHNIQKTKGAQDAKRSAAFTKIAKEIIVAVKEGGGSGDPNNNSRLATVIAKAKAVNMPNDNIKRTIDKALGAGSTENYEAVTYEGYGPGGDGPGLIVAAGAAAHRDPPYLTLVPGVSDAVGAERPADVPGKVPEGHGSRQGAHPAQPLRVPQGPRVLQPQGGGQRVVDAAGGHIQIRVHTDGGHVVFQQLQQQVPLGRVPPDGLHRQPFAVHHRVVADDQLAAGGDGLVRHSLGDVQRHQDL